MARRSSRVNDGEEDSSTSSLGDDALLQILDRLPPRELITSAAFVCRRWRRLCQSPVRELAPSTLDWDWMKTDEFLATARKNASTITKLHIPWSIREPTNLVSSFPHLRHLSVFSHCGGNPPPALALAMSPELESLTLRCYILDCKNPSPFLRALHLRCPRIHELRLEGLPRDTTHLIEFFSPSLTSLHLCCHYLDFQDVHDIFRSCLSLTTLCIISKSLYFHNSGRFDSFSPLPPLVTSLCLGHSLYHSIPYGPACNWSLIQKHGSQLEALYARRTTSATWQAISESCANLKVLDLSWVILSHGFIEHDTNDTNVLCELPSRLQKLEEVCLPTATDKVLGHFGQFCSQLRELRINTGIQTRIVSHVTDEGIRSLVGGCSKLQVLALHDFDKITVNSMRFLAFHCPGVRTLDLRRCKLIDDKAVRALFPQLSSSLQVLCLDHCPKISSSTLSILRERAFNLRSLTISPGLYKKELHAQIKSMKRTRPWVLIKKRREPPYPQY